MRISDLSIEQMVGQLFFLRPEGVDKAYSPAHLGTKRVGEAMGEKIRRYGIGGFVLFGPNIENEKQLKQMIRALHEAFSLPPLVCVDEEGGTVSRISNHPAFSVPCYESMQQVAETGKTENAYLAGRNIGSYLKELGFDVDLAPVADVNTNPENVIIGRRAFGCDPQKAAEMVSACVEGMHAAGVRCCLKHFPGHGDTRDDTHLGRVTVNKTWAEMKNCEMLPFASGIRAGADIVMSAHITALNIDGAQPATLSHTLLEEKLRREMGFDGCIMTDAIEMRAVRDHYPDDVSAVKAFLAGADILLMPFDFEKAYAGVLNAVKDGVISRERLVKSVERIHRLRF